MKQLPHELASLGRPVSASCFHVFEIACHIYSHPELCACLVLARGKSKTCYRIIDDGIFNHLLDDIEVRSALADLGLLVQALDKSRLDWKIHVAVAVAHLNNHSGVRFILLRGSEVSLDRVVQLQDSPLHHSLSELPL